MPRIAKVKAEDEEVVKRAPRRTVAKRASRTAVKREAEVVESEAVVSVRRKAPTRPLEVEDSIKPLRQSQKPEKSIYISGALFGIGLLAAALIGYSDAGQINPATVIAERNARLSAGVADADGGVTTQVIPVQNTSTEKNGGLIRSTEPQNQPLQETSSDSATTTATSTTEVASSTEEVVSEASAAEESETPADTTAVDATLESEASTSVTAL